MKQIICHRKAKGPAITAKFAPMIRQNFTATITYKGKSLLTAIVPQFRQDGVYYEVNIKGYPRFYMTWTELDRYDAIGDEKDNIPYELILSVSDVIEKKQGKQ